MKRFLMDLSRSWPRILACSFLLAPWIKSSATIDILPGDPFVPITPKKALNVSGECDQAREHLLKKWQLKGVIVYAENSWVILENGSGHWYRFKNNQLVDQYRIVEIHQEGVVLKPDTHLQTVCQELVFIPFGFQVSERDTDSISPVVVNSLFFEPNNE